MGITKTRNVSTCGIGTLAKKQCHSEKLDYKQKNRMGMTKQIDTEQVKSDFLAEAA